MRRRWKTSTTLSSAAIGRGSASGAASVSRALGLTLLALVVFTGASISTTFAARSATPDRFADAAANDTGREGAETRGKTTVLEVGDAQVRVYTPTTYRPNKPNPLVVMLHGCATNASEQQAASGFEDVADRHGFVVLFPDHEQREDAAVGLHPVRCWRFWSPADQHRGQGDAARVAAQTRLIQRRWSIDRDRTYLVGMSSGGMLTSTMGAAYPDVFAAIGVVAGCGYGAGVACLLPTYHQSDPSSQEAAAAHEEQGARARAIPMIGIHGTADTLIPPAAGPGTVRQWVKADNLALSGQETNPVPVTAPARTITPAKRRAYTVSDFRDSRTGCLVVRGILIDGMGHYWPGGPAGEDVAQWTDSSAPSGAALVWDFFRHFSLDQPVEHCTVGSALTSRTSR